MNSGSIPPKRPIGFGSSTPRFPEKRKTNTPGPGAYDPQRADTGPSHSFGRAKRSPNDGKLADKHFRGNVELVKLDSLNSETKIDDAKSEGLLRSLSNYTKESNITWDFQTSRGDGVIRRTPKGKQHSLNHTDFGKWALSDGKSTLPHEGSCSCYEIILKAGVENGLIDHAHINDLYQAETQSSCKYMDEELCKDKTKLLSTNPSVGQSRPKAGNLILFGDNTRSVIDEQKPSTNVHVVTAVGNESGPIRVISHHGAVAKLDRWSMVEKSKFSV